MGDLYYSILDADSQVQEEVYSLLNWLSKGKEAEFAISRDNKEPAVPVQATEHRHHLESLRSLPWLPSVRMRH